MKNIHVLPTDKPSRLFENVDCGLSLNDELEPNGIMCQNQNIYITSDEEIKEGDWVLFEGNDTIRKAVDSTFTSGVNNIRIHADKKVFKIILTTDEDLIKDGVQAIDDEFLEWFVKNPSCEEVKVETNRIVLDDVNYNFDIVEYNYKIIIPKEEQKQHLIDMMKSDEELGLYEEPKQEKSYSEEDMKLAFETGRNFQLTGENNFKELIKQFKK